MSTRQALSRCKKDDNLYHSHHIIPKSLGGTNDSTNLVLLTPREHFIAHLLLTKMVTGHHKRSMIYALIRFMGKNNNCNYKISSKMYSSIMELNKTFCAGKYNPMYGKPCYYKMTEDQKSNWKSNISKGITGDKNPFYGKTHTESTKKHISNIRSQPILVKFIDGSEYEFSQYKYLGSHIGKSHALGQKLCKPQHEHLLMKYGIKEIIKL
jgi:hypothetical protein